MTVSTREAAARGQPPHPATPGRLIAHRGASGAAPENTLAAVREAARQGARWIEVDVSLLGDSTPVLSHDATLERCSDGTGALAAIGLGDLAAIDAGRWFGAYFAGERIPTLDALLDLVEAADLSVNLELKAQGAAPGPLAAAAVAALATRDWAPDRVVVSSFDHGELHAFRAGRADIPVAALYEEPAADWRETLAALNAEAIHVNRRFVTAELFAAAREADYRVRVYTVNDPDEMRPWIGAGLTSIVTDHPRRFLDDPEWAAWIAAA